MAQTAAMKATAEAARLSQAIRRLASIVSSIRVIPSSNALRTAAPFILAASSSINAVLSRDARIPALKLCCASPFACSDPSAVPTGPPPRRQKPDMERSLRGWEGTADSSMIDLAAICLILGAIPNNSTTSNPNQAVIDFALDCLPAQMEICITIHTIVDWSPFSLLPAAEPGEEEVLRYFMTSDYFFEYRREHVRRRILVPLRYDGTSRKIESLPPQSDDAPYSLRIIERIG